MSRLSAFIIMLAAYSGGIQASEKADTADQPLRPVISAYTLQAGSSHICDTYLTPLHYDGWNISLAYDRSQAMSFDPDRWIMQLRGKLGVDRALNPARNAIMWGFDFDIDWSMMWRTRLPHGFSLYAGGGPALKLGALYLARNSNNPASAKGALTIDAVAMATWNGRIASLPVTIYYRPSLALTGIFFSPDYGELYYEIYLGNRSGLVHGAWPGNYFRMNNEICADLHLGNTTLRVGYRNYISSTSVNDIVTHHITHSAVLGVTTEWLSLRPSLRMTPKARVISAMY